LLDFENVVQRGHGLRTRTVRFAAVRARFVRLAAVSGDGFFSVAELGLYCRAPEPFPPRFVAETPTIDDGSLAPNPRQAALVSTWSQRLAWTLCGLALLFGLLRLFAPRRGEETAATPPLEPREQRIERRLHAMFVASGCAALIYEIVWFHLLRLVIGASALSVGLVLASFMGGMFLGSLFFARSVAKEREPLRVYAILELAIGGFGLAMPLLLPLVRSLYLGLFGYGAAGIALRALVAAGLLLPPTALMGATLPALARRYGHGPQAGASLASLYAANTFGAVLGCVLTGFFLLARGNVWVATLTAAGLNVLVGATAWLSARGHASGRRVVTGEHFVAPTERARAVYFAAALSGLSALGAQVVWTRLLTLLFGATVYAFSIILAVFLAGLGIGAALATRWLRRGGDATRGLIASQLGLVLTLLSGDWLLSQVLPYSAPSTLTPSLALHLLDSLRGVDVVLPSAILWGMSFPFALAAVSGRSEDSARASGRLYAANTLGAIVGALATSYLTIPYWGTRASSQALLLCAALSAACLLVASAPRLSVGLPRAFVVGAIGLALASVLPGMATRFLAHGRHVWSIDPADRYPYVSEGAAATVAVHVAPDGYRHFHVSGRVEASNNPDDLRLERLLGHLSALVHEAPHSVLVVGLGAGVTAGALTLHPEVERIVICEIEPRVTGATAQFERENYAVLRDPRVQLIFDDARHYLATSSERFDVITSDPIHPWVRGNSILFSREYYAIVREHLRPGGIATQWVPLYDTSEEAIQIQMRTFSSAFPEASVWNSSHSGGGYDVVLLGRAAASPLSLTAIDERIARNPKLFASLQQVGLGSARELLATYATSGRDLSAWTQRAPINDDFSLKLEYISGLALNQQRADLIYRQMIAGAGAPTELFSGPASDVQALLAQIAVHAVARH
jgi:spermidine synthase